MPGGGHLALSLLACPRQASPHQPGKHVPKQTPGSILKSLVSPYPQPTPPFFSLYFHIKVGLGVCMVSFTGPLCGIPRAIPTEVDIFHV